jgi:hypothetical protein
VGHESVRKVIPALTGLAQLHNLITLAKENKEEGNGLEARDVRINGKFSLRPVCVLCPTHRGWPFFHLSKPVKYKLWISFISAPLRSNPKAWHIRCYKKLCFIIK